MPMKRTSAGAFPASREVMGELPYVVRVDFSELAGETRRIVGKPISCHKCGAFLMSADSIREDPKIGRHFICPFCGTLNVIEGELVTVGGDTDIVVSPPTEVSEATTEPESHAHAFLAVIDVSGSMSGPNLAAVKRSLSNSIDSLAANSPDTLFGLIEFESTVVLRDMVSGEGALLPPETYHNLEQVMNATKRLLDKIRMIRVGENPVRLKKHVQSLRDQGGTALGPAIAAAYVIAKHRRIDRVLLLTDGLANEGIGALEGFQVTPATQYYEQMGSMFHKIGVAFDIVGIASGAGMELKTLGLLPEATGGRLYYVTPNELDRYISELAGATLLGRDVEVRLITPPSIRVKDASGVSRSIVETLTRERRGHLGIVGDDHELYFEVEPTAEIEDDTVPIQVQVEYTGEDGARHVRAVTTTLPVARREDEILASLDATLGATFITQKAGEDAFRGEREHGRSRLSAFRSALRKRAGHAPAPARARLMEVDAVLESEEEKIERQMEMEKSAMSGGPSVTADAMATASHAQMRVQLEKLFDESEEEEED